MVYVGYIVFTLLAGLFITPLSILWFISFCLARRKHDPARVGVAWIKAVFPLWIISLSLYTVSGALNLWSTSDDAYEYLDSDALVNVQVAANHVNATAFFFANLAQICLFITYIELANGFMLCLKGDAKAAPSRRFARIAISAWGFVLFALAVSSFSVSHALGVRFRRILTDDYSTSRERSSATAAYNRDAHTLTRLLIALDILKWLTSLIMLSAASVVVHRTRNNKILRKVAVLFLVATILDFIRLIVVMAISIHQNLTPSITFGSDQEILGYIVQPLFDFVFMFVLLVLLFTLAVRKRTGLWSQPQQEWHYPTVVYVPAIPGQPMPAGAMPAQQQQQQPIPAQLQPMHMQQPNQGLPAYLQVAQQKQMMQQQQPQQQVYAYYPQPMQQPAPVYQQPDVQQQQQQAQQPQEAKPDA
ncbi:hypothetical protein N657DRAFT_640856 [Parathielavia appendiculata]|uniref:Uncharacterized protein n=1 Tax=Parathielavia appendiculata TaxID=2587402 RepID=A0AAN6U5S3_9PEZI|nr:hypothetical protein N657DRAFT_640856 [Parathielavia appendiculata]